MKSSKNTFKKIIIIILILALLAYSAGVSALYLYKTGRLNGVLAKIGRSTISYSSVKIEPANSANANVNASAANSRTMGNTNRPYVSGLKNQLYSIDRMGTWASNLTDAATNGEDALLILPEDYVNIIDLYGLPALERMSQEEDAALVDSLAQMRKIQNLGIKAKDYQTPELSYKNIYADVTAYMNGRDFHNTVEFDGTTISELNGFLEGLSNTTVKLTAREIDWDMTLTVPSNIAIDADGVTFTSKKDIGKLIHLVDKKDVSLENFVIENMQYEFGLFIVGGRGISLSNSTFADAYGKAIVVLGNDEYIEMTGNTLRNSGHGAIIINGNITNVVLNNNQILDTQGSDNFSAGLVLGSVEMADLSTCFNPYIENSIADHLNAPHGCVIINNYIANGASSGIYSDGSYGNYFIKNTLYVNDKEGICLDQGTVLCYVADNTFDGNGSRRKMSQDELTADFVGQYGLAADGTSPAKLPGVSLDNAGYNIIVNNLIQNNSGSGVKMVRSCARNIIMNNMIINNNQGENATFHFFGVELGSNLNPDYATTSIDFTACFENIICRNIINGEHYSGIYIAEECYMNDFFDNMIYGSTWFSMECLSNRYNATANNMADVNSRGIDLSVLTGGWISLPGME